MPQFVYKALQRDGVLTEGFLDASNRHEAMRQVEGRGLKPIKLAESEVKAKEATPQDASMPVPLGAPMAHGPGSQPADPLQNAA